MKLSEFRSTYYEMSGKASEICRSLAFAGIAVVWIYKTGPEASPHPQPEMLLPTALLILGLALDLLQYVYSAAVWGMLARLYERNLDHLDDDPEVSPPRSYVNWPTLGFFWGKIGCIVFAYLLLICQLGTQWAAL